MSSGEQSLWDGQLILGSAWALWNGAVGDTSLHRHFAAQAVFSGQVLSYVDAVGQMHSGTTLLIEPLQPHRLLETPQACIVFIEPRQHAAADLPKQVAQALRQAATAAPMPEGATFWGAWLRGAALSAQASPEWELAVRQAIDVRVPDGAITVADIAREIHLSPERLRHVFPERVGMAFRRFVLWRRLWHAGESLRQGASATEAAHAAGFADAAHFSRTLRSTFGISASQTRMRP